MSQNNISNLSNKNISQSKVEERKDSPTNIEPKKNIPNPQTQNFNTSADSDTKRKKFQPKDTLEEQLDEQ